MAEEFVAWPFPVLKPEADWDEFDRDFLDFMRVAYAEDYQPRHKNCSAVEAESPSGRSVFLVFRGRHNGWEPFLSETGRSVRLGPIYGLPLGESACVCVRPPFRAAAHLALQWLRGRALEEVLADFVFVGGYPAGIQFCGESCGPFRCPCCGCLTLDERGGYEICPVCFWEDDGQDDHDADVVRGGPNGRLSLTEARTNYRRFGACEERFIDNVRLPDAEELPK